MGILEHTKIVWQLKTRFPGAKFIHKGPVQLLILAFEDPEITMNGHCYCGTNQECCVAVKKKDPTLLVRGVILHKLIPMWLTLSRTCCIPYTIRC
jgi:hypothetical protein